RETVDIIEWRMIARPKLGDISGSHAYDGVVVGEKRQKMGNCLPIIHINLEHSIERSRFECKLTVNSRSKKDGRYVGRSRHSRLRNRCRLGRRAEAGCRRQKCPAL